MPYVRSIYVMCIRGRVQFRVTFSSSTEPLTSDHAIFVYNHDSSGKIPSEVILSEVIFFCASSIKWSSHLLWMSQACKREPP